MILYLHGFRSAPASVKASRLQAQLLQYAPGRPFTPDNYQSLQVPSLCRHNGLAALGVTPQSLENVGARCLAEHHAPGLLDLLRRSSRR